MLYRETCDAQVPWDCDLPRELKNAWENWERMLTGKVEVPRSLVKYREEILSVDLRAFGDASSNSAAVYAVTQQSSGITQGLVTSKSRLAKKSLTIPKLELGTWQPILRTNWRKPYKDFQSGAHTAVLPNIESKGEEITSSLWEIEFGRSRTRITSTGETLGRRTTLLTSEAEVVIYLRQQTCGGLQILWQVREEAR